MTRFEHDHQSGAFYIGLREGKYQETIPFAEPGFGAGVDVDSDGNVLGFEFLSFEEYAELLARAGGRLEIPDRIEGPNALGTLRPKMIEGSEAPKAPAPYSPEPTSNDVLEEERRNAEEAARLSALERHGSEIFSQWEDELEQKVALADSNPTAFFVWVQKFRDVGNSYIAELMASHADTANTRLEAVLGVSEFLGRWDDLWRRIEEVTESSPDRSMSEEDEKKLQGMVEEVGALREALSRQEQA
jgi:uncharacterized protein YuzE